MSTYFTDVDIPNKVYNLEVGIPNTNETEWYAMHSSPTLVNNKLSNHSRFARSLPILTDHFHFISSQLNVPLSIPKQSTQLSPSIQLPSPLFLSINFTHPFGVEYYRGQLSLLTFDQYLNLSDSCRLSFS